MVTKDLPADPQMPDRIYAIGDTHGQYEQLHAIHALIADDLNQAPARTALIVHLGDYIDRGPRSADCLQLLASRSSIAGADCHNLLGNHEQMLLDALSKPVRPRSGWPMAAMPPYRVGASTPDRTRRPGVI